MRPVRYVHDEAAPAGLDRAGAAALRARVLREHRLAPVQPHLHHLPIARMAARAQHAAVLFVALEDHPVLHPAVGDAPVDDRLAGEGAWPRADRRERRALLRVVDDDGRPEQGDGGEGGDHPSIIAHAPD